MSSRDPGPSATATAPFLSHADTMLHPPALPLPPVCTGRLVATVRASDGVSVLSRVRSTYPLRLHALPPHGRCARAMVLGYGGGMVDGDRVRLETEVGAGASLALCTAGTVKYYPPGPSYGPGGGAAAAAGAGPTTTRSETAVSLGPGSFCAIVPHPTQCFARSRSVQR
eukprot:CAMPEP_0194266300 /NCGR_PEP_ID=MMETSP0169-20130528/1253_1 /TAXON_ID=218684 /ORGANISM="Corethron pennatum, Strain L29A3" /LENGTH=168 /DNA_ID=CAMNT_0039006953 /DNA_START=26 /DNA_END=529 /DNA_ORIENTATION=+